MAVVIDYPLAERLWEAPFGSTEVDRMSKAMLLGCVAVVLLQSATPVVAQESASAKWEFKAVSFNVETAEATKILNALHKDGWEYVGPLTPNISAVYRRKRS